MKFYIKTNLRNASQWYCLCQQTFTNYKEVLLNCHKREGVTIPKAYISTAAQVIFLLERVTRRIKKFEKDNDQSVLFTLNGDGSGSFEDFWNKLLFNQSETNQNL